MDSSHAGLEKIEQVANALQHLSTLDMLDETLVVDVISALHDINALPNRDDTERLLQAGVSIWNTALKFDPLSSEVGLPNRPRRDANHPANIDCLSFDCNVKLVALCRLRHAAADAICIAFSTLGGVSSQFDLDAVAILKFYTVCASRYLKVSNDADVCLSCLQRACQFVEDAKKTRSLNEDWVLAKALFDLHMTRAQCFCVLARWPEAVEAVDEAKELLDMVPEEREFTASVEYNFGVHLQEQEKYNEALEWLERSFRTRSDSSNPNFSSVKQGKTAIVMASSYLMMGRYEAAERYLEKASQLSDDPLIGYIQLKVDLAQDGKNAYMLLKRLMEHASASFDLQMMALMLLVDRGRYSEVIQACDLLLSRDIGWDDPGQHQVIMSRLMESCLAAGQTMRVLQLVQSQAVSLLHTLLSETGATQGFLGSLCEEWIGASVSAGYSLADRSLHSVSVYIMHEALRLQAAWSAQNGGKPNSTTFQDSMFLIDQALKACGKVPNYGLTGDFPESVAAPMEADLATKCDLCNPLDPACIEDLNYLLRAALLHANVVAQLKLNEFEVLLVLFRLHILLRNEKEAFAYLGLLAESPRFSIKSLCAAVVEANFAGSRQLVTDCCKLILRNACESKSRTVPASLIPDTNAAVSVPDVDPAADCKLLGLTIQFASATLYFEIFNLSKANNVSVPGENYASVPSDSPDPEPLERDDAKKLVILDDFITILSYGIKLIEDHSLSALFGNVSSQVETAVESISNMAWNLAKIGRNCLDRSAKLFDLCYRVGVYRNGSVSTLQLQKLARIMCICTLLDNEDEAQMGIERLYQVLEMISETRKIVDSIVKIHRHGLDASTASPDALGLIDKTEVTLPSQDEAAIALDPAVQHLAFLEVCCYARIGEPNGLKAAVSAAVSMPGQSALLLENIAAKCFDSRAVFSKRPSSDKSLLFCETALDCSIIALREALKLRLPARTSIGSLAAQHDTAASVEETQKLATVLRELIRISVSRRMDLGLEYIQIVLDICQGKYGNLQYPAFELQWVVATVWNKAQLLCRCGKKAEAFQWSQYAKQLCQIEHLAPPALKTMMPLIEELQLKLSE